MIIADMPVSPSPDSEKAGFSARWKVRIARSAMSRLRSACTCVDRKLDAPLRMRSVSSRSRTLSLSCSLIGDERATWICAEALNVFGVSQVIAAVTKTQATKQTAPRRRCL